MAMLKYFWAQFGHSSSYLGCREDQFGNRLRALFSLERTQEIDDFLLLLSSQLIEMFDDLICLAATALVISDGVHEVGRSSVMAEEDALSDAPERTCAEFVWAAATSRDAVVEPFAHVLDA